jgi:class 3 adenylate cyclase/tetratricopeptide (TPR) repeat protein
VECQACGTANPDRARFCNECGTVLGPGESIPTPSVEPRVKLPDSGDRRLVTVLFADISGFTSLSEKLDPEAVRDLIASCFDRLVPCIERYGGTIDKFIGDEIMALFGAPLAHENDPERALRAALEMRDALVAFNREREVSLGLHFGVNTGLVFAGNVGGGKRHDYSVMGNAVNVAARLKATAKSGEILSGPDTYRLTRDLFDFRPAETLDLKGKSEGTTAYGLIASRTAAFAPALDARAGLVSPLVGRDQEAASFGIALDRLRQGSGGIVVVTGEAGLGKSRLVAEMRGSAEGRDLRCLEGRTLSFGRIISYWPLLEILQQDAAIDADDKESERWTKLADRVTALFGTEAPEILPYLATLLSLPIPDELVDKVRYLDGDAMGRQVYRATRLYFVRLARERPAVLVFEDLHWLDGSSAALLEHLLTLVREVPLLFCLVGRPEADGPMAHLGKLVRGAYPEHLTEVQLQPLTPQEIATLATNLTKLALIPTRLQEMIVEKAGGNPFYVEEVVRSLIDQGGLVEDPAGGRFRVTDKAARIVIPDTLHGVIMARIDRLDDDLKQVLRLASVAGRTFFYRVLAGVAEAGLELDRSLAALQGFELLREKARFPELEYIFKHALVHEATYESILLQRRRELHSRVARATKELFPDRVDEFSTLLAYHYSKAEDWQNAQEYLFRAGDQAGKIAADQEALHLYEEAVEAYSHAFGDTWDPLERAVLERKMGEALFRRGDHQRAREYLYRALATLGYPVPESPGGVLRGISREVVIQAWHRLWPWFRPAQPSAEAGDRANEACRIYQAVGWIEGFADQARALHIVLADLNLAEKQSIEWAASSGAAIVGMMLMVMPAPRLSKSYIARARQIAERGGWPAEQAQADLIDGMREFWLAGDSSRAEKCLRRSWERFRELGDIRSYAGIAMGVGVHIPAERGEFERALGLAREIRQSGRDAGDRLTEAYGEAWESELLYLTGDLETGEAGMRRTIDAMLAATDYRISSKVAGRLAACLLVEGRVQEAQALLAEHRANMRTYRIRGFNGTMVITGTAAAALAAAEQTNGPSRDEMLQEAKRACAAALKQAKLDVTAFVPACRLRGTYEWLRGHAGKADKWWRQSLDHADKLGARYEGALTILEIGRRTGDPEQLRRAVSEFEAMGSRYFVAEAQRLLAGSAR